MKNFFTLLSLIFIGQISVAQFQFISPRPGSINLPLTHNIILRQGKPVNTSSIDTSLFIIKGSKSGVHTFRLVLCDDGKTINLDPFVSFMNGEAITVSVSAGAFFMTDGEMIPAYSFTFTTIGLLNGAQEITDSHVDSILMFQESMQWPTTDDAVSNSRNISGLFTINTNTNPSPGYIFFDCRAVLGAPVLNPIHSINIIDNYGDSIFQRTYAINPYDFQLGKNGYFDTYRAGLEYFEVLDSNFNVIDIYEATNGFSGDPHELKLLANGYAFLTGVEDQPVDDSSNQIIRGSVIQEFDPSHHVIFEWRSFDHVDLSESLHLNPALTVLDYVHTNSIEVDTDGNIITSNRNIDQINKIDVNTGEFIWRLGGLKNEYTFVNDSDRFYCQHDCRRIANGHITLYDDGNYHVPARSFAKEYSLDEVNKTITLVWSYSHPDVDGAIAFYSAMGSVQRLPDGNTFIAWGWRSKTSLPSITEVDPSGNIVWEITLAPTKFYIDYRAHKYLWNPCARPSTDSLHTINITKNSAQLIWEAVANPSQQYEIQYKKHDESVWTDRKISSANCYLDIANLDSATQYDWRVKSWCDTVAGTASHFSETKTFITLGQQVVAKHDYFFILYPNPVDDAVIINCGCNINRIRIFNFLGQQVSDVAISSQADPQLIQLSVSALIPGNYFVEVTNDEKTEVRRIEVVR